MRPGHWKITGSRRFWPRPYADIFYNNLLQRTECCPSRLPEDTINLLLERAKTPGYTMTVDLEKPKRSETLKGFSAAFDVDSFRRHCLLNGLDGHRP